MNEINTFILFIYVFTAISWGMVAAIETTEKEGAIPFHSFLAFIINSILCPIAIWVAIFKKSKDINRKS